MISSKNNTKNKYGLWINKAQKLSLLYLLVGLVIFNRIIDYKHVYTGLDSSENNQNSSSETLSEYDVKKMRDAKLSTTDSVFENIRIRTFQEYNKHQSNVTNHHVADEMPPITPLTKHCKRWGVVTTISYPTKAITRFIDQPYWCLVIVADIETPDNYMEKLEKLMKKHKNEGNSLNTTVADNLFYFSIEKQKEWENIKGPFGYFIRSNPRKKNIGYLFGITHGAEVIFDFDDDKFIKLDNTGDPLEILPWGMDPTSITLKNVDVIFQGANAFNHHPIMGASIDESWARGFPLELIRNKQTRGQVAYNQDLPIKSFDKEVGVIQFLVDGDPDVDAIHHSLSKSSPVTFPLDQLDAAKSVLVPTHSYAPYNAQSTIHMKNAMWAMLLPGTVPGRVSDIWRSYFAQCIFADAGMQLVFSSPKIVQGSKKNHAQGDFNAEQDLYNKSGKLINFLSAWDSEYDNIPGRMEQLWIDLYEFGYIEVNDVYAVKAWLDALNQVGYVFPTLKRRYRNVAVMGQFNYADGPTIVEDVIFWTQKTRERFDTVVAAGPFSDKQMFAFKAHFIDAISNHNDSTNKNNITKDSHKKAGFYTPLENLKDTLLRFRDSTKIEGVLYTHDDGLLNITELSQGTYPFPVKKIIAPGFANAKDFGFYYDPRKATKIERVNKDAYRIYPDGHLEDFLRTSSFDSIDELYEGLPLRQWNITRKRYCGKGQIKLARDPESKIYREDDGSILFSRYTTADMMFVPTKYANEYARAADLHLKHRIWIECAFNTVTDMVRRRTGVEVHQVRVCFNWTKIRGKDSSVINCIEDDEYNYSFIHPYKIGDHRYEKYSHFYDRVQAHKS